MKILEKNEKVVYRFRCRKCLSKLEMTAEEREENDWEHGEHKKGGKYEYPHNPTDRFHCPACNQDSLMKHIHKFVIMDNGTEYQDY